MIMLYHIGYDAVYTVLHSSSSSGSGSRCSCIVETVQWNLCGLMKGFCYVRAYKEAQDIFGLDFDFDEFKKYGRDDSLSHEDEDE